MCVCRRLVLVCVFVWGSNIYRLIHVSDDESGLELEPSPSAGVASKLRGLSAYERTALAEKFDKILSSDSNMTRALGCLLIYLTVSADPPKFCTVNAMAKNGKIFCDCLSSQATKLCPHVVAVAVKGDLVSSFVSWFNSSDKKVNLDAILNHNIGVRNASKAHRRT